MPSKSIVLSRTATIVAGRNCRDFEKVGRRLVAVSSPAPEGSRLVSCCPNLQSLYLQQLQFHTQRCYPPPQLHTLHLDVGDAEERLEALCQLTGLYTA